MAHDKPAHDKPAHDKPFELICGPSYGEYAGDDYLEHYEQTLRSQTERILTRQRMWGPYYKDSPYYYKVRTTTRSVLLGQSEEND